MKRALSFLIVALSLGLASLDADAARRFGGGGNLGKQRATPMQRDATPSSAPTQNAAPAKAAQPAPSATTPPIAPKPSFMQRWGGLLAGLGIGVLLSSLFGAQLGPIVGMILFAVLAFVVIGLLMRLFAGRKQPAVAHGPAAFEKRTEPSFSGIGSRVGGAAAAGTSVAPANDAAMILGGPVEPFLRVAKTSFLRLQAANDAGDLDDIRDYTTPEMYAEIAMQVRDRGEVKQKTEVVSVDAAIAEAAVEGDFAYASVRFWGLMREAPGANPEPFDEIWHVRRRAGNAKDPWVIAGIQQVA
jgi:predicted lipid-binding transport protein (Tim44 family)